MFYVLYKITNQINGKFYIGSHKTKHLNDKYMGSGKYLKYAQEKYGLDNFTKEILFVFDNAEDMYRKEAEIVTEDFISEENTYNLKRGGFGGFDYLNDSTKFENPTHSSSHSRLMTEKRLQKYNKNDLKQWGALGGNKTVELGIGVHAPGKRGSFAGRKHTEEAKQKMSVHRSINSIGCKNSQYGTKWIYSLDLKTSKKIKKGEPIPDGWFLGRKIKFD